MIDLGNIILKAIEPHVKRFTIRLDITYKKTGKTSKPFIVFEMFYNENIDNEIIVMRELVTIGTKISLDRILAKIQEVT